MLKRIFCRITDNTNAHCQIERRDDHPSLDTSETICRTKGWVIVILNIMIVTGIILRRLQWSISPRVNGNHHHHIRPHHDWRKKKKPIDLELQEAVRAQDNIGWKYFIRGIWSNEWRLCQEKYDDSRKVTNDKWASKIMTWLIETSFEIWKERNEKIHDTSAPLLNRQHEEAIAQVRLLYDLEQEVTLEDRNIFEMDVEKRILFPTKSLQIWVSNMSQRITTSIAVQQQKMQIGQTTISKWLRVHMMREKNTQENDKNENTEGDTDLSMQNENEQVNNRNQSEPRTLMRIE